MVRQPPQDMPHLRVKPHLVRVARQGNKGTVKIQQQEPVLRRPEPPCHAQPGGEEVVRQLGQGSVASRYATSTWVSSRISQSSVISSAAQR